MATLLPTITPDYIIKGQPKDFNITKGVGEYTLEKLRGHGSSVLMVDAHTGTSLTAAQILQDAVTLAERLREMGIGPGDTVGFCSENRLEYPPPVLATLFVGATCAPLNPIYTPQELIHTMSISRPAIVFCSPFTASKLLEIQDQCSFVRKLIVFGDVETDESFLAYRDLLQNPVNPATFQPTKVDVYNSVAVVLCSSGTTGLPKCVELTHYNFLAFEENLQDPRLAGPLTDEVILGLIPFFHGYGFGIMLVSMAVKIKVIVMSLFQEELFLEAIQNYKVTLLFAVPPLLVFLSKHPLVANYDLSSIRRIRCGAAPLSKDVQDATENRLKIADINQGYGMTELSIACVFAPFDKKKVGSSGVVTPGMDCKVIDPETGKALPPYKEGELCFKGPFIMKGYKNNKKATDETIDKEGWLHTGDIAYYDSEGFLFIVDRLKELIKFKGFQVAPAELEAILLTNPEVKDAAVIGIPDEEAGELPYAFVVRQPDSKITASEIQKFVADRVSPQKRLSGGVRFMEEIPKNPSGKILRKDLRQLFKTTSKL